MFHSWETPGYETLGVTNAYRGCQSGLVAQCENQVSSGYVSFAKSAVPVGFLLQIQCIILSAVKFPLCQ